MKLTKEESEHISVLEAAALNRTAAGLRYIRITRPGRLTKRNAGAEVSIAPGLKGRVVGEERNEIHGLNLFSLIYEVRCEDLVAFCKSQRTTVDKRKRRVP